MRLKPGYMKKLNRQVIRSMHHQLTQDDSYDYLFQKERSNLERRKLKKRAMKQQTLDKEFDYVTPEDRNKEMKKRVPPMRPRSHINPF